MQAQEREDRIEKEVKQRETRRSTQKSFRKLGYQTRGHVKPNSTKKSSRNILDVQMEDVLWRQIIGKVQEGEYLIERNVEQCSHVGASPLGYTDLGRELVHTGDTPMTDAILYGTLEHDSLSDDALAAILKQLRKHPNVQEIIQPIVTEADFKSAF
jgi:ketosteroid isomerase-like protein